MSRAFEDKSEDLRIVCVVEEWCRNVLVKGLGMCENDAEEKDGAIQH
jgi:hypothetical protein